jgi:hypothetical protein
LPEYITMFCTDNGLYNPEIIALELAKILKWYFIQINCFYENLSNCSDSDKYLAVQLTFAVPPK